MSGRCVRVPASSDSSSVARCCVSVDRSWSTSAFVQMPGIARLFDGAASDQIGDEGWAAIYFEMLDRTLLVNGDD